MLLRLAMLAAALLASGSALAAADEPPAQSGYKQLYADWKKLLTELRQLQEKYPLADKKEQQEIEARFQQLLADGKALEPKVAAAAEKEFAARPNQDKDVSQFLLYMVNQRLSQDETAEAARLAKLLTDNKASYAQLPVIAARAFFANDEFDAAAAFVKQAREAKLRDDWLQRQGDDVLAYPEFWKKEQEIRAAEAKANDLPRVKLSTDKGDLVVELLENEAPNTVANFISLVEKKFYDGTPFHRVLPGFMAQGGDPQGTGRGGPGYKIRCECHEPNHRLHFRGTLSMAHGGRDTGGSQFFLTFVPTPHLNGLHTAFGRVVEGIDVLAKVQRRDPESPEPPKPDRLVKATVIRKRAHPYEPKTLPE